MSDFFIGEIRIFPYPSVIPAGWLSCDGQILQVTQYQALFALLSNTYGGNGQTTFALPKLNGKVILGQGQYQQQVYTPGNTGGSEAVVLSGTNLPPHLHAFAAGNSYQQVVPGTNYLANPNQPVSSTQTNKNLGPVNFFVSGVNPSVQLNAASVTKTGAATPQGHENRQPFIAMKYCISTTGIWPPRD